MAESLDGAMLASAVSAAAAALAAGRDHLDQLDAAFGDGDHGRAVAGGFAAAAAAVEGALPASPGEVLSAAAAAIEDHMGGAAGPLYATVLHALADAAADHQHIDLLRLAAGAVQATEDVARRGRVAEGDGSMLDALAPYARALRQAVDDGVVEIESALERGAVAAERGASSTSDVEKRRGRASSHPSRGVGHPDPGASSFAIVAAAAAEALDHPARPSTSGAEVEP